MSRIRLVGSSRVFHRSWSGRTFFVLSALLLFHVPVGTGFAEDTPASPDPVFTVRFLDGKTSSGRLTGIGPGGGLILTNEGKTSEEIALTKILKLTRETSPANLGADGPFLIFPEGDRLLRVSIGAAVDNTLEITSNSLGKLKVPIDSVLGVVFAPPSKREALDTLWDEVRSNPRTSEQVWMTNGDRRAGGFLALNERSLKFQIDSRPIDIDRSGIVAIGFDPTLISYARPQIPFLEVVLMEGTRLGISGCQLDHGQLTGTTRFGQSVRFPISEVIELHARSDAFEYLTEREVAAVQYVPYVGPPRPYRLDRAVDGRRFQLSGQFYDRGIGVQSRTLLAYKLKPGDRRFQAIVGLDDRAGSFGSVAFRVLVDGKERFATPSMAAREPAKAIDIDLEGAKNLILITEFGDRGDVQDLGDWVEARIIRQ